MTLLDKIKENALFYALCGVFSFFFFRYCFAPLFPFFLAFCFGALLQKPQRKLSAKIGKTPSALLLLGLIFLALFFFFRLSFSVLLSELWDVLSSFQDISFWEQLQPVKEEIYALLSSLATSLGKAVLSLPSAIAEGVLFFLALFYFCKDYDEIFSFLEKCLPSACKRFLSQVGKDGLFALKKYMIGHLELLLLTETLLLCGFLFLGIKDALTLSLLVATVDFLPILGTSAVLVPWSVSLLLSGNQVQGYGLLILCFICYGVKQIAEPKIISRQMNVPPLLTLLSIWLGAEFFHFWGVFLAPLVAFLIKTVFTRWKDEKVLQKEKNCGKIKII